MLILWDSLKFAQVIFQTKQPKVLFEKGEWCSLREQGKCPLLTLTLVVLVVLLGRHIFELFCAHIVIIDLHVSLSTCSVCVFDTLLFTLMWSRLREAFVWNPVVFLCKNPPFASEENPQFASQQNPPLANEENPQFASEENPQFENEENPQFAKEENQQFANGENPQFANEKIHNLQIW